VLPITHFNKLAYYFTPSMICVNKLWWWHVLARRGLCYRIQILITGRSFIILILNLKICKQLECLVSFRLSATVLRNELSPRKGASSVKTIHQIQLPTHLCILSLKPPWICYQISQGSGDDHWPVTNKKNNYNGIKN
jgi:hypothetical protein